MEETIRFKREELYEMVWAKPVTKLAKSHGLSDVGFAKICRKLKVRETEGQTPGYFQWIWLWADAGEKVMSKGFTVLLPCTGCGDWLYAPCTFFDGLLHFFRNW